MNLEKIEAFIKQEDPVLYLLTPCFGSVCYVHYTIALLNTFTLMQSLKLKFHVLFCNSDSLVPRARNNLIAKAMSDPKMTHIIFVDADITWKPEDILKLLLAKEQVVGGVYPIKKYDFSKLKNMLHKPESFIKNNLVDYNVNVHTTQNIVTNNLMSVKHLACGFMMIRRSVLETMFVHFAAAKYTDDVGFLHPEENNFAYAIFDCAVEDGHYMSEDWLFCSRWSKLGGRIMADISIDLNHIGVEHFEGSFRNSVT